MANGYDYEKYLVDQAIPPPRPKKKKRSRLIGFVVVMVLVFCSSMALGFFLADSQIGKLLSSTIDNVKLSFAEDKQMNVLLLGVDQREQEKSRADTIMVAFIDLAKPQVNILSIPRDTYVSVPGYGYTKINHANAYGGPELVQETAEDLLGVPIDRYLEINFESFKDIIDTLGGIEINVEKRMYYPQEDINLQPGLQVLNGYDALAYVRYRNDAMADLGRIERQQKFMKALVAQTLNPKNIFKIPSIIEQVRSNIKTNLTSQEMLAMGQAANSLNTAQVDGQMLPGTPTRIDGVSYWNPDEEKLRTIVENILNPVEEKGTAHAAQ